jgi:hypothetical protein
MPSAPPLPIPPLAPAPAIHVEPDSQERRPFWKDPIVVVGAAVPTLVLAVFFGYLAWPHTPWIIGIAMGVGLCGYGAHLWLRHRQQRSFILNSAEPRSATKFCPFCAEEIKTEAKKCRHCGEMVDSLVEAAERQRRDRNWWLTRIAIVVLGTTGLVAILAAPELSFGAKIVGGQLLLFILIISIVFAGYFLPTIIASSRSHPNVISIFIVNFLLGWTLVGYVVALAWSFMAIERK